MLWENMTVIAVLTVLGVLLILAELVLPGGILGLGGTICLLAAVGYTFTLYGPLAGAASFLVVLLFGFAVLGIWMKFFRVLPVTNRLVLRKAINDKTLENHLASLLGKKGFALTRISPSGYAEVEGERLDVLSETGVIEKGSGIRIVGTRGPSIFVEKA